MKELLLSFKDNKTEIFIDGVKQKKVTYFRFEIDADLDYKHPEIEITQRYITYE